jgi:hypothetical protein
VADSKHDDLVHGEVVLGEGKDERHFREITFRSQVFDIYLPDAVCGLAATDHFIRRLGMFSEGATLYRGVQGDWYSETEPVRVLRLSITTVNASGEVLWEEADVRAAVRRLVAELMHELECDHGHSEEAVFFNDWPAQSTVVTPVRGEV